MKNYSELEVACLTGKICLMNWTYLLLAYVSLIGLGLADNIRGPVYPDLLAQFHLSNSTGALFFGLNAIFAMLNNFLASYWLPRLGVMRAWRLYVFFLFTSCVVIGLAENIISIWIGVSIMGLGFGGLGVTQNLLTVHGSTPARRTQALGGLHTMYALASVLAPILVTLTYPFHLKWNTVFLFASLVPLSALVWSLKEKTSPILDLDPKVSGQVQLGILPLTWVATFTTLYVMAEVLISSRLVLYVRTFENYTPKQANDLLSAFFVALLAGRLLLTVVRVPAKNSTLLRSSLAASLVTILLALFVNPLWFAVFGLTMSFCFPCMIAYAAETFGSQTARVMSWIFTGNYVGLIGMHFVVGVIADTLGLRQALFLGPLFLVTSLVLLVKKPISSRQVEQLA